MVAYWSRLYGLQTGLKLSTKQQEETAFLIGKNNLNFNSQSEMFEIDFILLITALMDWLEKFKKEHHDNEAISNEIVAQAHLENYALKLFTYADQQDRAANFNK